MKLKNKITLLYVLATYCIIMANAVSLVSARQIYSHVFNGGTAPINGSVTTTGGGSWVANSIANSNGVISASDGSAVLPFKPVVNRIYTVSMDLTHSGASQWVGLGFCRDALTSVGGSSAGQRFSGNPEGIAWMIYRDDIDNAKDVELFGGVRTNNVIADSSVFSSGTHRLSIILDTSGDGSSFSANFLIDGVSISNGFQIVAQDVDDLNFVGFTSDGPATGNTVINNFSLSDNDDDDNIAVSSLSPFDDAVNVWLDSELVVNFDTQISPGTGNIRLKNLTDGTEIVIPIIDPQVSILGSVLIVKPDPLLLGSKDYAIQIDPGAIEDLLGSRFSGITNDTEWNFTTSAGGLANDTDADGLPDDWEMVNLGSLVYGAGDDPDGDGFDNIAELGADTNPSDSFNYLGVSIDPFSPTGLMVDLLSQPERTTIPDTTPEFCWIFNPSKRGETQAAYEIIVASTSLGAGSGIGDVWSSGKVDSAESINVAYGAGALVRGSTYFWRVRTWGGSSASSEWSPIQRFTIEASVPLGGGRSIRNSSSNEWSGRYQPQFDTVVAPVSVVDKGNGNYFIDFGKDAFGYFTFNLDGDFVGQSVEVRLGEKSSGNSVDTSPGGTIRSGSETVELGTGNITYEVRHSVFTTANGYVPIPWAGDIMPFRYVELIGFPGVLTADDIRQYALHVPFDEDAANFTSSDTTLNAVWDICQYSMKATSFAGVYVDGDRERRAYEADAYINQICHYGVDRDFALGRYSYEYLLDEPTWPTEWFLHMPLMAWADYMETGNKEALAVNYDTLIERLLLNRTRVSDGLLETDPDNRSHRDIVDWPVVERDGYVLSEINTVVNSFQYRALRIMAAVATELGKATDAVDLTARADRLEVSFNSKLWNNFEYKDGETTGHVSAHANFFPMALGLVPADREAAVMDFLKTKRMPCSVYGAQYLLEALFEGGEADHAIGLMADNDPTYVRHFWNMITSGSTITMESWDLSLKANLDWNHAWGAAPANIIPRYVLGLKALTAGYGEVEIKPQLGTGSVNAGLSDISGTIPTIRGAVKIEAINSETSFRLQVSIPGNMKARILIPNKGFSNSSLILNGTVVTAVEEEGRLVLEDVPSGDHVIWLNEGSTPSFDSLIDNWRLAMFGGGASNPAISADHLDPDSDGRTNLEEFHANTNPLDKEDLFTSKVLEMNNVHFQMLVPGKEGRSYSLQRTTDLFSDNWTEVDSSLVLESEGDIILTDDNLSNSPNVFYRAKVHLP